MKKVYIVIIIALFVIAVPSAYLVFDRLFPKADQIICPDLETVTSILLNDNDNFSATVESADFSEFLVKIENTQPTRTMSVNDYPAVRPYYSVVVETPDRAYQYFIYAENAQTYIEIPYEGVYKANEQILTLISKYFNN